jgi:DNA-binding NtrC family response regulator
VVGVARQELASLTATASLREAGELLGLDRFAVARRKKRLARQGGLDAIAEKLTAVPSWVAQTFRGHPMPLPESGLDLPSLRRELEERAIVSALRAARDSRSQAARLVGMSRTSLGRRLQEG